jgi:hypothetical protein
MKTRARCTVHDGHALDCSGAGLLPPELKAYVSLAARRLRASRSSTAISLEPSVQD